MRRAASIVVTLSLMSLGSIACLKPQRPASIQSPVPAAQIPKDETGPFVVIGHLEHRDRVVTIKSGEQGLVYSVRNRDGRVLFDNLTAAQLKMESPEIHDFIEAATAGQAGLAEPRLPKVMR